ncbi:hypothetical protein L484_000018 [Morus notabilis]|uniref:Uncharacterized protein n=1 Tax=Morus notabilis TaxID=981085 RepID=W9T311_9ROSA|nr:hypothetical protein L484_000018 [Morus notabilis]
MATKLNFWKSFQCLKNIMCWFLLPDKGFINIAIAFPESPIWQDLALMAAYQCHMISIGVEPNAKDQVLLSKIQNRPLYYAISNGILTKNAGLYCVKANQKLSFKYKRQLMGQPPKEQS